MSNQGATPAGALSVLARIRAARPAPSPYERCEMCGAPVADAHQHVVNVGTRSLHVHLPPVLPAVHPRRRRARLPGRAGPLPRRSTTCPRRSGRSSSSRSGPRSCSSTPPWTGWSRSTRGRPAPPSPSCRSRPGTGGRGRTRARHPEARRRGAAGARGRPAGRGLPGADRRLLRAGRAPAHGSGAGSTAGRTSAAGWTSSSTQVRCPLPAGGAVVTDLAFEVLDVLPQQHAASPHLLFRLRVTERSGAVVHAIALRAQLRIEPQRRPYDARRAGRPGRPVRHPGPVRQHPQAVPVDARVDDGAGLHRSTRVRPAGRLHLRLRGRARRSTCTRCAAATCRSSCCSAAPSSPAVTPASRSSSCPGRWRPATGCRWRAWRQLMDLYFPGSGWIRLDRETIDALARYRSARGLTSWEQTLADAAAGGGADAHDAHRRPPGRRRRALRGLPALPLPGLVAEEPGALAVRDPRPGRRRRGGRRRGDLDVGRGGRRVAADGATARPVPSGSCRCSRASCSSVAGEGWRAGRRAAGRRHPLDPVPRGGGPRDPAARTSRSAS